MKKVGVVLAEARQKSELSIDQIAAQTHIRPEYVAAIEKNAFESLPAAVFVKGFLQQYARLVGVDEQTVLALFRRDFSVGNKGKIIPREFLKPVSRTRSLLTPKLTAVLSVSIVVCCIFGYAFWLWIRLHQPPLLIVETPEDGSSITEQVVVAGSTQSDAVVYVNTVPVSITPDGKFSTELFVEERGEFTITIRAEDRHKRATVIQRTVVRSDQADGDL